MPQPASTRLGLVGPSGTDPIANGDDIIRAIIAQLDPIAAMYVSGTFAARPAAAVAGRFYKTTDTQGLYYDTGSAWLEVVSATGGASTSRPLVTTLPTTGLTDGMEVLFVADASNRVLWGMRYNASGGTYKWEFTGGPPLVAEVSTNESTSSGTYTGLSTAGPSVALPLQGDFDVEIGAAISNSTTNDGGAMSFDIGATPAVDTDAVSISGPANATVSVARSHRKTALTAVTLVSKYKILIGGTATFGARFMKVTPIRCI